MKLAVTALSVAALAVTGAGFTVPASAGCESRSSAQYCDAPIRSDGTWQRCQVTPGGPIYGPNSEVRGWTPETSRCYDVDPAEPLSATAAGGPRYHIDP